MSACSRVKHMGMLVRCLRLCNQIQIFSQVCIHHFISLMRINKYAASLILCKLKGTYRLKLPRVNCVII